MSIIKIRPKRLKLSHKTRFNVPTKAEKAAISNSPKKTVAKKPSVSIIKGGRFKPVKRNSAPIKKRKSSTRKKKQKLSALNVKKRGRSQAAGRRIVPREQVQVPVEISSYSQVLKYPSPTPEFCLFKNTDMNIAFGVCLPQQIFAQKQLFRVERWELDLSDLNRLYKPGLHILSFLDAVTLKKAMAICTIQKFRITYKMRVHNSQIKFHWNGHFWCSGIKDKKNSLSYRIVLTSKNSTVKHTHILWEDPLCTVCVV